MSTIKLITAASKSLFCKKLTLLGELDRITDPSKVKVVAIVDYRLYDKDDVYLGNEGVSERMTLAISMDDLINSKPFIDLVANKIDVTQELLNAPVEVEPIQQDTIPVG